MPDRRLETIHLAGLQPYGEMVERQLARHQAVARCEAPNTLYLLEHAPVVTLGREAHLEHLLLARDRYQTMGIEVLETGRGGDVTYHGPGQLVAYPLLNLNGWRLSVGWYLRTLEQVVIDLLGDYDLEGLRVEGLTGVWVRGAKVAAIGIGLRRWTTFHGVALNVSPSMAHFGTIVPCGIADRPVTSLELLLGGSAPALDEVAQGFDRHFRARFEVENVEQPFANG